MSFGLKGITAATIGVALLVFYLSGGDARFVPIPLVLLIAFAFRRWFAPDVVHQRVHLTGLIRVYAVFGIVFAWYGCPATARYGPALVSRAPTPAGARWMAICACRDLILLSPLGIFLFGWTWWWLVGAFFTPYVLPIVFAFKPNPETFDSVSGAVFEVLYDVPMSIAVWLFAVGGWRLNELATALDDDGAVLLGAVPFSHDVPVLKKLGVVAVVNMCREHAGPVAEYHVAGIEQLHLPTRDGDMPSEESIAKAVDFLSPILEEKRGKILIHCRVGIGRSSTVALALLARRRKATMHDEVLAILNDIRRRRPEVADSVIRYTSLRRYLGISRGTASHSTRT